PGLPVPPEADLLAAARDHGQRVAQRGAFADEHVREGTHASTAFLRTSASPSGVSRRTRTIRGAARPSPYGFGRPRSPSRKPGASAVSSAWRIASRSGGTSSTLSPRRRPSCRLPTLTAGSAKEGASIRPLEELPTIASAWCSNDR